MAAFARRESTQLLARNVVSTMASGWDQEDCEARSDEEVDQHIVKEPHRVGWPDLQPLPSSFRPCNSQEEHSHYITNWQAANQAVHDILTAQLVDFDRFELGLQRTAGTSCKVPMLRIEAHDKGSGVGSWHNALLRIVRNLQNFTVADVQVRVEMIESRYPRILPAETEDAAVDIWATTLAPRVMGILARRPLLWQSVSLVRLSSLYSVDDFLTVLIEAANAHDSSWGYARAEIMSALSGTWCRPAIWQMQPVEGLGVQDLHTSNLDLARWKDDMSVGDGIAPAEEEDGTGTVGGFIQLRSKEGDISHHILTNFHVIKTPRLQQYLEPPPLRSICLPQGSTAHPVKVPSNFDSKVMLKSLDKSIQIWHVRVHDSHGGRPSCFDRAVMGDKGAQRQVEDSKSRIEQHEKSEVEILESSKRPAGAVRATSGYEHLSWDNKKLALDWALVEVDPSRLLADMLPSSPETVLIQKDFDVPSWASDTEQKWSRSPQSSQKVVKLGRMMGWTCGRLGAAKCFWRSLEKDDYQVGDWHDGYGTVLECLQVFDRFEEETPEDARQAPLVFAAGGDSGSVVRDFYTGAWVGLLFGAHRMGWALMTPMAAFMHSIESVTGEEVVDPMPME